MEIPVAFNDEEFTKLKKKLAGQSVFIILLIIAMMFSFYQIYQMNRVQSKMLYEMSEMDSRLARTSSLAENANKYAHFHY